jgi:hypothetical protein
MIIGILEIFSNWIEVIWIQNAKDIKETRKQKKKKESKKEKKSKKGLGNHSAQSRNRPTAQEANRTGTSLFSFSLTYRRGPAVGPRHHRQPSTVDRARDLAGENPVPALNTFPIRCAPQLFKPLSLLSNLPLVSPPITLPSP